MSDLLYIAEFDSIKGVPYKIEVHKKGYDGASTTLLCGSVPFDIKWDTDEVNPAIKGSHAEIRFINEGSLPLTTFYSPEDDTFFIRFYQGGDLQFSGYLVQDDCREESVDFRHEIVLSASDNLGLLKDISFDQACDKYKRIKSYTSYSVQNTFPFGIRITPQIPAQKGDVITFLGTDYTIDKIENSPFLSYSNVFAAGFPIVTGTYSFTVNTSLNFAYKEPVYAILNTCIKATNINLDIGVFSNLLETTTNQNFITGTYLQMNMFRNGDRFDSCYTVLEKILKPTGHTLMQANGRWNIIRWAEAKPTVTGLIYDHPFESAVPGTFNNLFDFGYNQLTYPETGLEESILRPYKLSKETFNYKQPDEILLNGNFSRVGELLNTYPQGTDTVYEYEMTDWNEGFTWNVGGTALILSSGFGWQRFIRVVRDSFNNETARYGVTKFGSTFGPFAASSSPIEVTAGDRIKITGQFKTITNGGAAYEVINVNLVTKMPFVPRGVNNRAIYQVGGNPVTWSTIVGYTHEYIGNSTEWQSLEIVPPLIPFDGMLYIQLPQADRAMLETHFKDIRIEILKGVNESTNTIGHTHTDSLTLNIKNKYDEEIFADDSLSNTIAGTFFTGGSANGVTRDRTIRWKRSGVTESKRMGEIFTEDMQAWRSISRKKYEGTFYTLKQGSVLCSPLCYFKEGSKYYLPGTMEIDYRNDNFKGTLIEFYETGETLPADTYEFKYLYQTK